jgi:hypothetical protein
VQPLPHTFSIGCCKIIRRRNKVAACAKHFVGDGGTHDGINENNTIIDRKGLMSIHMPAYLDALRKGVSTVMISYSSWNGLKMHANHNLITGFLKGEHKFQVSEKEQMRLQSSDAPLELGCSDSVPFFFVVVGDYRASRSRTGKASTGSPALQGRTTPTLCRLQFLLALTW